MEARRTTRSAMFGILLLVLAAGSEAQINDIQPAPASIGADVPAVYFGPAPSLVDPRLVGPVQLLKSGTVNANAHVPTIILPLYRGILAKGNKPFYYIVTDTTAKDNAEALGINHAAKLRYALVPGATRKGSLRRDLTLVTTNGHVDFSPHRSVTAGKAPNYFPPTAYTPGAVGKDGYSPLVEINGEVYNAPIVSMATADQLRKYCAPAGRSLSAAQLQELRELVHDKVVSICPNEAGTGGTVELLLTTGFSFGKPVLYLSLDSSSPLAAAIEAVTYAPAMNNITVGGDDSLFSAVERLFTTVNGYTNGDINRAKLHRADGRPTETTHPLRQGLGSALRGDGSPLNILGGIPTVATDYSPMWDLNIGRWTDYAVANSYRERLTDEFQYLGFVQRGFITNPDGRPFSSSGIIVNCPIVQRLL